MKRGIVAFVAGCALVAASNAGQVDTKRTTAIWDSASNRLDAQYDIWFKQGDFPRVIETLRLTVGLFPSDFDYATSLGWMLENVKLYDEALAVYIKFRKDNPMDADSTFPEASFYYRQKLYAKVPPLIEPSLKGKPHANSFRILAHSYDRLNLLEDSKRVWQALVDLTKDPAAVRNLERVTKKMGRP